jgi:hypothetical protein
LSQSKMPPQQGDGLLDLVGGAFGLGAHVYPLGKSDMGKRGALVKS